MNRKGEHSELEKIREELNTLNERLQRVERNIRELKGTRQISVSPEADSPDSYFELKMPFRRQDSIETGIGVYGMGWLGNIVLLLGFSFLFQWFKNNGFTVIAFISAFGSVAVVYAVSYLTRKNFPHLARLFSYNGHFLLYFFTLHLHFFELNPVVKNKAVAIFLVLLVIAFLFWRAWRDKSQVLFFVVQALLLSTGIISNIPVIHLTTNALVAALAVLILHKFGFSKLYAGFIFLVYFSFWIWLLNNPLLGNRVEFIASPGPGIVFLFAVALAFSLVPFIHQNEKISPDFVVATIIFNGVGFTAMLLASTLIFFSDAYVALFAFISAFCMIYSVLIKTKTKHETVASMYALYGFLSMSVAFYGLYGVPFVYFLFALQSLLVVSMALWFRSRFIVVMNTLLYFMLLIFYLRDNSEITSVNFSFMLVAFVTARILNWKKARLNIQTETIRNLYLLAGFGLTLLSFYHALPESYITASWIFAALAFFLLSSLLNNIKYRWLAIASVLAAAMKLVFFDMADFDIGYRALVFMGLAIIALIVSIRYSRYFRKKPE